MPETQTVSINKMRADAVRVTRALFGLTLLPGGFLIPLIILPMVRDLPHVDLAPLRSPLVWLLVALTIARVFMLRYSTTRLNAPTAPICGSCLPPQELCMKVTRFASP